MHVGVVALDGVLDSSLSLALDVLAAANRLCVVARREPRFSVRVLGATRRRVRTGCGYVLTVDQALSRATAVPALVIVPGWNEPDPERLVERLGGPEAQRTLAFLCRAYAEKAVVAASCSATFLLAETGLLDGVPATTTWWLAPRFRARYPRVDLRCELSVARAERLYTAGAALSQVDLMLAIVSRFAGTRIARSCVRFLALESHPTQSRYMMAQHLAHDYPEVSRAEAWIRTNLAQGFTIADVAKASGTSTRTLARRIQRATGMTPMRFAQRMRVEEAARLLETTDLGFDEITWRVGYTEPAALRRLLKRELGRGPRELRLEARGALSHTRLRG